MPRKKPPTPEPRGTLTKDRVLNAAAQLADAGGTTSISMRKIAEQLGVEAMSLYHHVANKDEILDGLVDMVFSEIELPKAEDDWKAGMRRRAHSARAALLRHRWAVGVLDSRRNPGPMTLRHHDAVLGCLRKGGFSVPMAAHAYALLDSYVYGFAMQELALPFSNTEELKEVAEEILPQMPANQFPHLTELTMQHVLKPGYAFANEFPFGLELILDGLEMARRRK